MNSEQSSDTSNRKAELRDKIHFTFSPDDLHGLAIDFDLDYDELPGESKARRVVELIEIVVRQQRVLEFIERCHKLKPKGNFQPLLEAARQEPHLFQLENEYSAPETAEAKLLHIAMELLDLKKESYIQSQQQISQNAFSKPTTSLNKADLGSQRRSNETWAKSSNLRQNFESTAQQSAFNGTIAQSNENPPQLDRLQQDIAHLQKNLVSLGEIDSLLENIDDLLSSMRKKISDLLVDIKVKHQRMQEEGVHPAKKSDAYHREQSANFQESSTSTIARQQRFAKPLTKNSDWADTKFTKPN